MSTTLRPQRSTARGTASADVVCRLDTSAEGVEAVISRGCRVIDRATLRSADPTLLGELRARHRRSFDGSWRPGLSEIWADATEQYLAALDDVLSGPLRSLLSPHPAVALGLGSPLLASLPVEAAHSPGGPALLDLSAVHRLPTGGAGGRSERRSFRVEVRPGDDADLSLVHLERQLVAAVGSRSGAERLIHISGHRPGFPTDLAPGERSHVVLSGCETLATTLPAGVAAATVTLWPVDDTTVPSLGAAFAARVSAGVGPAEALRQAQLLHRSLPAVGWGAFVHLGAPL